MVLAVQEPTLGYCPSYDEVLTLRKGHCQAGSLTGAVASQRVTEAREGSLRMNGNHPQECKRIRLPDCETDESNRHESGC